jgi:hypothetical protein
VARGRTSPQKKQKRTVDTAKAGQPTNVPLEAPSLPAGAAPPSDHPVEPAPIEKPPSGPDELARLSAVGEDSGQTVTADDAPLTLAQVHANPELLTALKKGSYLSPAAQSKRPGTIDQEMSIPRMVGEFSQAFDDAFGISGAVLTSAFREAAYHAIKQGNPPKSTARLLFEGKLPGGFPTPGGQIPIGSIRKIQNVLMLLDALEMLRATANDD